MEVALVCEINHLAIQKQTTTMNLSNQLSRTRLHIIGATLAISTVLGANVAPAHAAVKPKPLKPPAGIIVTYINPTEVGMVIDSVTQFQDYQLIAGPGAPGPILNNGPANSVNNVVLVLKNLLPNSNYTLQIRNKNSSGVSAWLTQSFSTPPDYPTPVAPQNLRVINVTATTVTVAWDFDQINPTYLYTINGGQVYGTYAPCAPYCAGSELASATIPRPAPGTTTRFSVTATSSQGKVSAPAVLIVTY